MSKETIKVLSLKHIIRDPRLQMRAKVDEDHVTQLTEVVKEGKKFHGDLPVVFNEGSNNWLADGFQRAMAIEAAGQTKMECQVIPGSYRDAFLFSLSANAKHGARRTNDDKKKAVKALLEFLKTDEQLSNISQGAIAAYCAVTQPFVSKLHSKDGTHNSYECAQTTVGLDGRTINVSNIGKATTSDESTKTQPQSSDNQNTSKNAHSDDTKNEQPDAQKEGAKTEGSETPKTGETTVETVGEKVAPAKTIVPPRTQKKDPLNDGVGVPVVDRLRDVFGDPWLHQLAAKAETWIEEIKDSKVIGALKGKSQAYSAYLRAGESLKMLAEVVKLIDEFHHTVKAGTPFAQHARCKGQGCDECRNTGWFPQWLHEELMEQEAILNG